MEQPNDLQNRIEHLEAENRRLRHRETQAREMLRLIIDKLPLAAVAIGVDMKVISANAAFVEILDHHGRQTAEQVPSLCGADFETLVSESLLVTVTAAHNGGRDVEHSDLHLDGGNILTLSVYNITPRELTLVLLRPMYNTALRSEEIAARLGQTVDRNMKMIQQIAFLLGEEVSDNAKVIGSVIKLLRSPQAEAEPLNDKQ